MASHTARPQLFSASLLAQRLRGPGGLYNLGNLIGFGGGLIAALVAVPREALSFMSAGTAMGDFVWGSPAALALTLATLVFLWSGEEYHRAWSHGFPPDERKIRTGDLSSAVGAFLLCAAFFALGHVVLALTSGLLHATGKLGSAVGGDSGGTRCREIVLVSRIPAMAMASMGLVAPADAAGQIVSATLLVSCVVWAAADVLLLPAGSVLSPRRYFKSAG